MSDQDFNETNEIEATEATEAAEELEQAAPSGNGAAAQAEPASLELTDAERAQLADLDAAILKFEGQKRWSDVIKSILAKVAIVRDPADKVELLRQAGEHYVTKSSNQAEAIKAYEQLLEYAPHDADALRNLREMYEKRRDWESLIRVMQRETDMLPPGDRAAQYVAMADIATQKLRKPEVSIELWQRVLENEPSHPQALEQLVQLYERSKEWEKLAQTLEILTESTTSDADLKAQLTKLGTIYADKTNDDHGAVRAFRRLLSIDPDDRRAQEALKKKYVALKAWDDLEEFYAPSEKWDELIRLVEREADDANVPKEERISLLFRTARLWADKKQKSDRAARAYEKVLDLDPQNREAAEALSPIYEAANDAKKLVGTYEVRLIHVDDPAERIALLRETGLLYEERLKQPQPAFDRFLEAFSIAPETEVVREDVERVVAKVDGWDKLIAAYAKAIDNADEDVAIDLRMNFGGVLTGVNKIPEAIGQYRAVYEARSDHAEAIAALGELYRKTNRFPELLEIYERRIELEPDMDARRQLSYAKAGLYENELSDAENAIASYRAVLTEYGDDEQDAYRALDSLFEKTGKWQDLAETLERRIDLGPPSEEELAALKFRLGRVYEQHLGRKPDAVNLMAEVLMLSPEHDGARLALENLLADAEVGVAAASILEPVYEGRGEHENLLRALRVLHDGNDSIEQRLELITKMGTVLAEQIGDKERAFAMFAEGLREAPDSEDTLARLEMLAIERSSFKDLVDLVSELAGAATDPVLARTLWIKAARIQEEQTGDVDGAVAAYGKCLELDPGDMEVLLALDALYRRTERYRDLVGVLRKRFELTSDPIEQEELLAQMSAIHDTSLREPDEAIRLHREILQIDPASPRALAALDDLFQRQQMWGDLADNVDRQLALANDPDEQIALMIRLAVLRETRMSSPDAAIEIYRQVLERDASNEQALAALERLLAEPQHQVVIAEILEPIYQSASEFKKLVGVHEIQAFHASSPERRVELLHRIAELHEVALDDAQSAFSSFARALAEDPANTTTQEQLDRLARSTGSFEPLAQVYEERVQGLEDVALAAQLHVKAAEIREQQLGDFQGAIDHYKKVLTLDDAHIDAASSLERLYYQGEKWEDLASICLTKSKMLPSLEEQKDYLYRAATIYEDTLERPTASIDVYKQVLELDSEDMPSLDKLIELYLRLENWSDLLGVYTRKADIVGDSDEKKSLYIEVGAVFERELNDIPKAIDTYQKILEIDPDDLTAIGRLDSLYQATGNWQELLAVLEREADLAQDPNDVISFRYRIAALYHKKLNDPAHAVEIYREILDAIPDHDPTLVALESIIDEGAQPVAAALVLDPIYRQSGEYAKLIRVLEVQNTHEEDNLRRVELLHQVASLYEDSLDDAKKAFEAYGRALPNDNRNEDTIGHLERLAMQVDGWDEVARLYEVEITKILAESPGDVVDLALRAARTYEGQIGDVDNAISRYRVVIEAEPGHAEAVESLDRLYEATGRWNELAEVLGMEIEGAADPEQSLHFQFRLGQTAQLRLNDLDRAVGQYRDILGAAPEHGPALLALEGLFEAGVRPMPIAEILEPLYRMQEAWEKLLNLHEVQLHFVTDRDERVRLMHRMAEIAEDRLADGGLAFTWFSRALLESPLDEQSLGECERLAGLLGEWDVLADTYASAIERNKETEARVEVGRRLARVYEEELSDIALAEEAHRFVLGVAPSNEDTLVALDRIYVANGAHESLVDILRRRIAVAQSKDDQIELMYRLGHVLEDDLTRTDDAIKTYQKLLDELDAEHVDSIRALEAIYTRKHDWLNLSSAFEKELAVVFGDTQRAELLARMARLADERLQNPERSVALWRQVLELRGEDLEALNAIGTILARQENWRDLVDILEREAEEARAQGNDDLCIRIYSDLGRIWYGKLQREQSALEAWERVLEIDPTRMEALFQIAEIHRASKQWSEVTNTLHRIVDTGTAVLDEPSLEHVYMQLGWLYKNELEQPADAADAYRNALEVNPANFDALAGLELVHREDANWDEVIGVMERRVPALSPADQVQQLLAIAATWQEELDNPDGGTSAFTRILEIEPLHAYAFERLEGLHRDAARWDDLNEMYLSRVEATESVEERVTLLGRVANVSEEKLSDLEQAFDALSVAWSLDYTNTDTARELERVTASANKWHDLLTAANASLQVTTDPATRIAICLNCARWYGKELGHPEYAIPYYHQILALDTENVPAMQQMGDLYRSTGQWDTLAQVLGRLVDMTKDPDILANTYTQMGELAEERLGVPEQAPDFYYKALDQRGNSLPAMNALERIHRDAAQWPQLLDILHKKVNALENHDEILETRLQIAETYEDRTRDNARSVETYKQVLDADPVNLRGLKGLERLYAQMQKWPELMAILERELDVVQTERERIAILVWMATMWEEEFLKPDRAAERLEQVIDISPMHESALMGLERLYRRMQKWPELVDTYQRHIDATPERAEKIRCFKAVGEVHSTELNDVDRAIDSFLAVLDINDNDIEALEALNRLYAKRGDHSSAIEMMEKLGKLVPEPSQRVELEYRIGYVLDTEMGDRTAALEHYIKATDVEPAHLPSLEAMRKIHLDSGDWVDAARVLEQEAKYTETPRTKAIRLTELGKLLDENLDEHERAVGCYEEALRHDTDNEEAAMPLVREYTANDRHAEAFPLLKMLVRRSGQRDVVEQHNLAVMLGEVSSRIGDTEEAIKAYGKAHQLNPQDLGALFGLAGAHFDDKDWEKSSKYYQMLLMQRDSLDGDRYVEILYKLGVTKREQGEKPKALNFFDKALAEDGRHLPTLEAIVSLYEDQKNFEQVVHFKKQILEVVDDDKARFALLEQIGDIWREKLKNHAKAIEAYHEASDLNPENHVILHKLLESYQQTKQWPDVIATIERISELDGRPQVRSKYAYTVGVIVRDEMKDPDAAIEKFNAALDLDADQLKPFEAINKIFTAKKDWKGLERAYRKMLLRIMNKGKPELEFNFLHTLGIIYRDRLKNLESAAEVFRMASNIQPDHAEEHQILAELYAMIPARLEDAITEHQWLIQRDPYSVDSYRALYRLYFETRAYDKAWCLASTLCFLKKADQEQQNFYQQYKPQGLIRPTSRLDNERWVKELLAPDEDRYVAKLMEILAGPVHALRQSTDKALNLIKEKPVDVATSTVSFVKTFNFVQQVLGISMPLRLYLLDKTPGGLVDVVGAEPPAIKAGSTLLTGFTPQDLAFVVGRHLAYYRPEHFIRRIFASHTEIKMVLLAGLRIAGVGAADPAVDQWAQQLLTKMTQPQIDALRSVTRKFVEAGGNADVKKWMQQVELSACRAGFLMSNDLDVASKMIQQLPPEGTTDLAPKDKIKELVLFSVSENYFRLREALGIQIQV